MIKKLLPLFFLFSTVIAYSREYPSAREVEVDQTIGDVSSQRPRSFIRTPEVYLSSIDGAIQISLLSSDSYILRVVDAGGVELCQFSIVTDGAQHPYIVGTLDEGNYSIIIESDSCTFEGGFTI